jgi:uncharacterized protein (TIGR03382 family)
MKITMTVLSAVAASAIGAAVPSANAGLMQAVWTFDHVQGQYGNASFTDETLTVKFVYDTDQLVQGFSAAYRRANFVNGRGALNTPITVTLGNILTNAAVDDVAGNSVALTNWLSTMYIGRITGGAWSDMSSFVSQSGFPGISSALTSPWQAAAMGQGGTYNSPTSVNLGNTYTTMFMIGGLALNPRNPNLSAMTTGAFSVSNYIVPAPGAAALLGLAGVVGGRRRRA